MSKEMMNLKYEGDVPETANDNVKEAVDTREAKAAEKLRLDNLAQENKARLDHSMNVLEEEMAQVVKEKVAASQTQQTKSEPSTPTTPVEAYERSGTATGTFNPRPYVPEGAPVSPATTEIPPTQAAETWDNQVSKLSASVKKLAQETAEERSKLKNGYYKDQIYADNAGKFDPKLPDYPLKSYLADQLEKQGVFNRPGKDGQPVNREKSITGAHEAVLKMTPQELRNFGISSGSLDRISPDDKLVWTTLEQKLEEIRSAPKKRGFFARLFRK